MTREDIFQAIKPFVADYAATTPDAGRVVWTVTLVDGSEFVGDRTGELRDLQATHDAAKDAAYSAAFDALVSASAIADEE